MARPHRLRTVDPEVKKQKIQIVMTPEQISFVRVEAARRDLSVSQLMRQCLEAWRAQQPATRVPEEMG